MPPTRSSVTLGAVLIALASAFVLRGVAAIAPSEALTLRAGAVNGSLVVFALATPALHLLASRFVLPVLVPEADHPFPRLERLGVGLYALGIAALLSSLGLGRTGQASPGWSFVMAWSPELVGSWSLALAVGVASLAVSMGIGAIGVIVALHRARARGHRWKALPALAWSLYAQSVVMVAAAPMLVVSITLLVVDRGLGAGLFDPAQQGDPVLFMHGFWLAARPLLISATLPVLGVAIDVVRGLSGRRSAAPPVVWAAMVMLALTSALGWAQHLPEPATALGLFTSFANVVSAALLMVLVGHLVGALRRGSVLLASPLLYALAAGVMVMLYAFVGLGSSSVALGGALELDWFGTYGLDILLAATLLAAAAGLLFWWPRLVRRRVDESHGRVAFALHAVGLVAYFGAGPPDLLGSPWSLVEVGQRLGAGLAMAGTLVFTGGLVAALRGTAPTDVNPWQARGREWLPAEAAAPAAE